MDLREINDAFNKLASDVRAEMAESEHQREMLHDVVKSCIQACPEQSSWKCESPAVFVRHLLSMRDAEIAKLREERDIHLASIAEHSKQLAAARAALAVEREACDKWRRQWQREGYSATLAPNAGVMDSIIAHDDRRAAEAKEQPK